MNGSNGQVVVAAVFAVLVLGAAVGTGFATTIEGGSQQSETVDSASLERVDNETAQQADEVYVKDDGTVVLVYNDDSDETTTGHLGANVTSGLMHLFLNGTLEGDAMHNASGNASLALTPDKLRGAGDMLADKPDQLANLSVAVESYNTRENANASAELSATLTGETATESSSQFVSMTSEGTVETTGTQFSSQGSVQVDYEDGATLGFNQSASITLQEHDDRYTLDVARSYQVSEFGSEQWATEEKAQQTLQAQFSLIGQSLDGDVSVELESHEYDDESRQLDIEYTVTFRGVDAAVSEQLTSALADAEDLDLDEQEAEELTAQIQELQITTLSASVEGTDTQLRADWDVQIDNYDQALLGVAEIAESVETTANESLAESIRQSEARIEAQRDADLTRTMTWDVSVSADDERVTIDMTAEQTTENWEAYVSEVDERESISMDSDSRLTFEARTVDGQIEAEGSFEVSQDGLIDQSLEGITEQMQSSTATTDLRGIELFQSAGFERASMDVSLDGEHVTVEGAARFENASVVRSVFDERYGDNGALQSVYTDINESEQTTYVRFADAVSEGPSESAVRELALVGPDSKVHLPGEWDEDETQFGEFDEERAQALLDENTGSEDGGMNMTLVAAGAGLFALVAVGLVVLARRF